VEHDAASDQAGDLLERHARPSLLDQDAVLLVAQRRLVVERRQELAFVVVRARDAAADRSAVHVDIQDREEDRNLGGAGTQRVRLRRVARNHDPSVGR
jgi:hypothetical protein